MELSGAVLALLAFAGLIYGAVWFVINAFKRSFWWGLLALLLFPFAVGALWAIDANRFMRPAILAICSFTLIMLSAGVQYGSFLALGLGIIITAFTVCVLWPRLMNKLPKSIISIAPKFRLGSVRFPMPRFSIFRATVFKSSNIEYDSRRFRAMQKQEKIFFEEWGKLPTNKQIADLFYNESLVNDLLNFEEKFFGNALQKGSPDNINWKDERYVLFFQMLRNKYNIISTQIIAMLMYVFNEKEFERYQERFASVDEKNLSVFVSQVARQDILDGEEPNYHFLERLVDRRSIVIISDIAQTYETAKQQIKLYHFEESLSGEAPELTDNIENQIKRKNQQSQINSNLQQLLSLDPKNYIIVGPDYSRDSRIDNYYRKHFATVLSRSFDGHCCRCGEGMGQLEFDHFWWPKSQGGSFLMRSRNGSYVNNCIPLCRSCNSSKGPKDFRDFFNEEEVNRITEVSQSINKHINRHMIDFVDSDFPERVF